MKLLLITHYYHGRGGSSQVNRHLANLFQEKGFILKLISLSSGSSSFHLLVKRFMILRILYYLIRIFIERTRDSKVLIVHPCLSVLVAAILLKRVKTAPLIFYLHDTVEPAYRNSYWARLALYCESSLRKDNKSEIWYISEGLQNLYIRKGLKPGIVVPHMNSIFNSRDIPVFHRSRDYVVFPGSIYGINEQALRNAITIFSRLGVDVLLTQCPPDSFRKANDFNYDVVLNLSFNEYLSLLKGSLANLILLSESIESTVGFEELSTIFPTKLIDYLVVNRPIMYLANNDYYVVKWLTRRGIGAPINVELSLGELKTNASRIYDYSDTLEIFKRENIGKSIFS